MSFDISTDPGLPGVETPRERFCDTLLGLLEEIAAIDIKDICISTAMAGTDALVRIGSPGGISDTVLSDKKLGLYQRKFSVLGGDLQIQKNQNKLTFLVKLPIAFNMNV